MKKGKNPYYQIPFDNFEEVYYWSLKFGSFGKYHPEFLRLQVNKGFAVLNSIYILKNAFFDAYAEYMSMWLMEHIVFLILSDGENEKEIKRLENKFRTKYFKINKK